MDEKRTFLQDAASIDEEAVAWFVVLRDDDVTELDRTRFASWLNKDPLHQKSWLEVEVLWNSMAEIDLENVVLLPTKYKRVENTSPLTHASELDRKFHPWGRRMVAMAVILMMACGAGLIASQPSGYASGLFADYRTGTGERETVTLADGSSVTLGASSALSVSYTNGERHVTLHYGESFFSVTKDATRPFVVQTTEGNVIVLGTRFDVKQSVDENGQPHVYVGVSSGKVQVVPRARPRAARKESEKNAEPLLLTPGQAVYFNEHGADAVRAVEIAGIGFWRQGRMVFQNVPLREVLYDLDRYKKGRIIVVDSEIASLPVTGVFDMSNPDAALAVIAETLPIKLVPRTDYLLLIKSTN